MGMFSGRGRRAPASERAGPPTAKGGWRRGAWILLASGLVVLLAYMSVGQLETLWTLRQEAEYLEEKLVELKEEQEYMEKEIEIMETREWVEQAAREELDLVRPGDMLVIPKNRGREVPLDNDEGD